MLAKIENGKLMVEWYRVGDKPVFREVDCFDRGDDALVTVVAALQARIDELERRLSVAS